jgi:phage portal protein BeeE
MASGVFSVDSMLSASSVRAARAFTTSALADVAMPTAARVRTRVRTAASTELSSSATAPNADSAAGVSDMLSFRRWAQIWTS